ncbi:MAG: transglycosylase SLT domain-containing protein, partial [Candidatus Promineifilaceae bacterium]
AGYVYPLIAEAYRSLGDAQGEREALAAAVEGQALRLKEVQTRIALAASYLAAGDFAAAIEQYDAVHELSETEATRGQMTYLAGAAELAAGSTDAAYERFQRGITDYPGAYESYLGLVELVKAEIPVDDYQRGLVDYNAAAYAPAIEALQSYVDTATGDYKPEAHFYLALSQEALGESEAALAEMARYAMLVPQDGLLQQAKLTARSGDIDEAIDLYGQYVAAYPESEDGPFAAWWLAALTAESGEDAAAIEHFIALAEAYPEHLDAPEALHVAGRLAAENDDMDRARSLWLDAARQYPTSVFGSAALLDLILAGPDTRSGSAYYDEALAMAASPGNSSYEALRARDLALGIEPFTADFPFEMPGNETAERALAETWLAETFDLDPALVGSDLGEELAGDERLAVGARLWQLGLYGEGKRELEALRQDFADDPLSTYQLALFFRDLGLFSSSIASATTLLNLASTHELEAPAFIGRLTYPTYYGNFIMDLAQQHGFDPRLQLSLVRQESLFESFARSGAAAQGLSQVIPDTGAWIAEQLQWPDYENEDLYKPYVGLTFGAYYLAEQLSYFDGDVPSALAAYNAGPGNAIRWHKVAGGDIDQFVEAIDFSETETYVKRIYAGYDLYRELYGGE